MTKNHLEKKDIIGKYKIVFYILLVIIILDRMSKYFSLNYLTDRVILIPGILNLNFTLNSGAAFGMLKNQTIYLIIISLIFILIIAYNHKKIIREKYYYGFALIISGALTNLYDRIMYLGVIDFIEIPFFSIFNIGDIAISVGAMIIIYYFIKENKKN